LRSGHRFHVLPRVGRQAAGEVDEAVACAGGDVEVSERFEDSPEYHLYGYLSGLLDACVRALTDG